ncbi:MAG: cell division protein FtsQ/DivIB [Candidatus Omnitrophota bacterium]|nr:cell division protein FtsQ/DivIB [Candidatus Omnitrophota bacterium]
MVQIKLNRYYLIDGEGIVLPWVNNAPVSDLPLLIGINFRKSKVSIGQRYPSEKLDRALESLKALSSSSLLAVKDIALVNTGISGDIILTTKGGLKIRLGKEDFEKKISLLERVLEDIYIKHKRIELIDLRFGDVIVKEK